MQFAEILTEIKALSTYCETTRKLVAYPIKMLENLILMICMLSVLQSWQKLLWTVCVHLNLNASSRKLTTNHWFPPLPLSNVEHDDNNSTGY